MDTTQEYKIKRELLDVTETLTNLKQKFFSLLSQLEVNIDDQKDEIEIITCPYHKEKTGSFLLNKTQKVFNCLGCGKSGELVLSDE